MSNDRKNLREAKPAVGEVTSQPSQRRRRLVKGALSAPVFLTLQNGSVFANTSNDATVVTSLQDAMENAQPYQDASGQMNILCVDPESTVTSDSSNPNRMDFGNGYQCLDMPIGTGKKKEYEAAVNQCTSRGGYIIAGSSHASIC